jgi:arylsulfatase A-like enzyme
VFHRFSPEQALYASDYPYGQQPDSLLLSIKVARAAGFDDDRLRDLLSRSAERIAAGALSEQLCMTMDWSATMLEAAGASAHPAYPLDGVSLLPVLRAPAQTFERPLRWRMNHRGQRALRRGRWKYLRVDGHDYLFDLAADERERANRAAREAARLDAMRADWEEWNASMPAIPGDATVSLGYGAKDMPQR